ncbi:hypothetical protein RB195_007124 [Necator americanus]|uniref:Homeobox domain-containing protein n=1 Tax=Necator americanus TaxID=51031 RepID=A0ABR1BYK5_NECAM
MREPFGSSTARTEIPLHSPFQRFSLQRLSDQCRQRWRQVRDALRNRGDGDVYTRRSASQGRTDVAGSSREQDVLASTAQDRRNDTPSTSDRIRNSSQPPMRNGHEPPSSTRYERRTTYRYHSETRMNAEEMEKLDQLEQWLLQQPLEKRKLDLSDRQVAMLAGLSQKTSTV